MGWRRNAAVGLVAAVLVAIPAFAEPPSNDRRADARSVAVPRDRRRARHATPQPTATSPARAAAERRDRLVQPRSADDPARRDRAARAGRPRRRRRRVPARPLAARHRRLRLHQPARPRGGRVHGGQGAALPDPGGPALRARARPVHDGAVRAGARGDAAGPQPSEERGSRDGGPRTRPVRRVVALPSGGNLLRVHRRFAVRGLSPGRGIRAGTRRASTARCRRRCALQPHGLFTPDRGGRYSFLVRPGRGESRARSATC